jgi:hypothetical protein
VWVWSWDALSVFVSERANSWREAGGFLQLLSILDTKNESASEDQSQMRKWIIVYNYLVFMWVSSSDALSFCVSKMADKWRESNRSLQLLALFHTNNESASDEQTDMRRWIILYNYSDVMWVWSGDAFSFFVLKRVNNWREGLNSLHLLALSDTENDSASQDQTQMTAE